MSDELTGKLINIFLGIVMVAATGGIGILLVIGFWLLNRGSATTDQ